LRIIYDLATDIKNDHQMNGSMRLRSIVRGNPGRPNCPARRPWCVNF
jgi:hypothetical protein